MTTKNIWKFYKPYAREGTRLGKLASRGSRPFSQGGHWDNWNGVGTWMGKEGGEGKTGGKRRKEGKEGLRIQTNQTNQDKTPNTPVTDKSGAQPHWGERGGGQ